jgi:hypothetical protein
MTVAELEVKLAQLQAELNVLRHELLRMRGGDVIPVVGPIGTFKDDPTFADAVRPGRECRERVNRESLEEMDREEAPVGPKKKRQPRKTDART